jgi:phage antirepressor YoqD-like protein
MGGRIEENKIFHFLPLKNREEKNDKKKKKREKQRHNQFEKTKPKVNYLQF